MDINERILDEVKILPNKTLELYYDDTTIVYDTIVIPSPIERLVSDYVCNKLVLPESLKVIDLNFETDVLFECKLPEVEYCKMVNIHWAPQKPLSELFKGFYYYSECTINKKPLHEIIYEKYKKYFNEEIYFKKNVINQRIVGKKVETLILYENMLEKCKARSASMKEELVQLAYHPVFVNKWFAAGLHPRDM